MYDTRPIRKPVDRWIYGVIKDDKELLGGRRMEKIDR